ncbi:alkaline phosphatase family protein [Mucilaginibacter pocheonensis]|uniref:DUF4983 domain-containing protein n=1 Tax=Mucilaginibacter pocheonensis TaxID=398050 RepID=A0ABU1T6N6_9SPHI|nr:alkaline phosphatase family protein [Mucilaginibacter pocheonensis]MDR6941024.1 hypothetical protein [Mucilaginibacter pocheonensis]
MSNIKEYRLLLGSIITAIVITAVISCNKDFSKVIPGNKNTDTATVTFGKRKVLYLIVDGARGASVLNANTPNIDALLPHSIYSWVALSDPDSTADVSNWANMLTGVKKEKHQVLSNDFSKANLQTYPVIFKRIKEIQANNKIVSFASSAVFKNNLTGGANVSELYSTDAEVKTAVVNDLKTDTASLVVGQFNDIDEAGAKSGYDNSIPAYKSAIEKFDTYVGEIMTALKSRSTYKDEDWLVVISSSGGGTYTVTDNDNTVFSKPASNSFIIYYNQNYRQRIIAKPFTGNRYLGKTVRLSGESVRAEIDTADVFNLGDTTEFTIELKVKKNADTFFWPSILGKREQWSGGHPSVGWVIYLEDRYWYFEWRGKNDGDYHQCRGADLQQGRWENISVKGEVRAGKRYVRTYTNGVFNNELELTPSGSLDNNNPLKLGFLNGQGHGTPDVYITDIRFFKTDVPDAVIGNYSCETSIDEGHPYYNFLAGYWPATDGEGGFIRDVGPQALDFQLKGDYKWEDFNDLICSPPTESLAALVPQTADIPAQIINWFKIASKQSWNLDGRVWIDQ